MSSPEPASELTEKLVLNVNELIIAVQYLTERIELLESVVRPEEKHTPSSYGHYI